MKKVWKTLACVALAAAILWSAVPSDVQQNASYMGPGPMSVVVELMS